LSDHVGGLTGAKELGCMGEDMFTQFADIVSEEEEWFFVAEDLRVAAEALEPEIERYWKIEKERERIQEERGGLLVFTRNSDPTGVYFMLIAYAIENLCKGLLVKRAKDRVWETTSNSGEIPRDLLGHDLLTLLKSIKFPLRSEDEELAFRLKRSSVWSARYPVPVKAIGKAVLFKRSGEEIVPVWSKGNDLQVVKEFYTRVGNFVTNQLKAL
jgi:hypothetical protein